MDLKNQTLAEKDYRQFILDDYTFLKHPIFIVYSKKVVEALKEKLA